MKKMLISKSTKRHDLEYHETYNIRHYNHIAAYCGEELSLALAGQEKDIDSIYALKIGSYTLDLGEYYFDVDIMER